MIGNAGILQDARERFDVRERDVLLFPADDRDGNDGRSRLDREAHEAETELAELVALVERLRDAARAFGKHEERFVLLEEAPRVLRDADDLADAREEKRHERERLRPLLDHRADEARWLDVHEHRRADERAVDRNLPRVIRDQENASRGDGLGAEHLAPEIVPMKPRGGRERVLRPLRIEAERIHAGLTEVQRDAREARLELFAEHAA